MDFKRNDQVVVRQGHLHGNFSELKPGQVVSVSGDKVVVSLPGEMRPREYPKDQVQSAAAVFGIGANFNNPREMPIKKMFR
jgi:hypothetical protein